MTIKTGSARAEHLIMVLFRLLRSAQSALGRGTRRGADRPHVVLPDSVLPAQPTRSTSPSYVNLMAPLPTPSPRRAGHDAVVDLRDPR